MSGKSDFQTINTKVVVDPTGVKPGLDKAESAIKTFATSAKGQLHGLNLGAIADPVGLGGVESRFSSLLGAIGTFAKSPMGIATGLTAGFLGASEAAHHFVLEQSKGLVDLEKSSQRLGMTRRERGGFDLMFGAEGGENAAHAFIKMNKLIGDAALGSDEAQKKLGHFGITVEQALGRSQTANIEAFSKAIAAVPDPMRRTAMAIELLGRAGGEYMPEIMKIAKGGLSQAQDFAADIGYSGSDEDVDFARHQIQEARKRKMMLDAAKRKSATAGGMFDFMSRPMEFISEKGAEGVASNTSWLDDLMGEGDVSRHDWKLQEEKFKSGMEATKNQKAAIEQYKGDQSKNFIADIEKQIAAVGKLNETFGMTAEQISIFNMQEKLAGDNTTDAATKMQLMSRYSDSINQQSTMAKFGTLSSFSGFERSLGLSPNRRSNIATGDEAGSLAAAQAIQAAQNVGGQKPNEERWAAAIEEQNKKMDEDLRYQRDFQRWREKNPVIIKQANVDN